MSTSQRVALRDVNHSVVCGSDNTYCAHPRLAGIWNFGGGEIVVGHHHAVCDYDREAEFHHTRCAAYREHHQVLLQRSPDGGQTWPAEDNVVLRDTASELAGLRDFLHPRDAAREEFDMSHPEAAFYFGHVPVEPPGANAGDSKGDAHLSHCLQTFALRSADKCRTWERAPFVFDPPPGLPYMHVHNCPIASMPDGTFLLPTASGNPAADGQLGDGQVTLYGTDDDGMTWHYVSQVACDPTGRGRPTYSGLVLLPSGRLLCTMLSLEGQGEFLGIAHSDDGGLTWSRLRSIVRLGRSPWAARRERGRFGSMTEGRMEGMYGGEPKMYRSPWPLRLADGRIVVLFTRRRQPTGLGLVLSEDDGRSWSDEHILLDRCVGSDLGYPVATQLEDGRVFTAHYLTREDGVRYIAGTHFSL